MSGLFRALRKALGFSKAPKRAILPIRDLAKFAGNSTPDDLPMDLY